MVIKIVKFEWFINYPITIAKAANLLGPGTLGSGCEIQ